MAEELRKFADELETAENFDEKLHKLVCNAFTQHQRIIFDGNGYSDAWKQEAAKRGLSNYTSTAEALAHYVTDRNIDLVTRHGIFTENEFRARHAIHMESYNKVVNIEARTMVDMALHQILPAAMRYTHALCDGVVSKKTLGVSGKAESALITKLSDATDCLYDAVEKLKEDLEKIPADLAAATEYYHNMITRDMKILRKYADTLEQLTDKSYWPYPIYSDLLFY
jgi:glutamine synthetase